MQKGYNEIQSVEIELRILEQASAPPSRPREYLENDLIIKNYSSILVDKSINLPIRIKKVRFVDEII